ncbi:MAG TPA: hypothetical protein VH413_07615 [Verrucomicrobiae bacterium]|jgi:hypothetical protein|nr:hypothetical protein [Verrucomicrobiae bacterium]
MSEDQQDFGKLKQLLKLKRYEQPPPGYFNGFSGRVVDRIEATGSEAAFVRQSSWLRRVFNLLETNPVAAGLFGMSICGLLISAIAYSQYQPSADYSFDALSPVSMASVSPPDWAARTVAASSTTPSINPIFNTNSPSALFGGLDKLSVQQVSYSP